MEKLAESISESVKNMILLQIFMRYMLSVIIECGETNAPNSRREKIN